MYTAYNATSLIARNSEDQTEEQKELARKIAELEKEGGSVKFSPQRAQNYEKIMEKLKEEE